MGTKLWNVVRHLKWHQWARVIAVLALFDQWAGPFGAIPSDIAVVIVALGALFAPVPTEKTK